MCSSQINCALKFSSNISWNNQRPDVQPAPQGTTSSRRIINQRTIELTSARKIQKTSIQRTMGTTSAPGHFGPVFWPRSMARLFAPVFSHIKKPQDLHVEPIILP